MRYLNNPAELLCIAKPFIGQKIDGLEQEEYAEFHELYYGYRAVFVMMGIYVKTTCMNVREVMIAMEIVTQEQEVAYFQELLTSTGLHTYTPIKIDSEEIFKTLVAYLIHKKTGEIPNEDYLYRGWDERYTESYI